MGITCPSSVCLEAIEGKSMSIQIKMSNGSGRREITCLFLTKEEEIELFNLFKTRSEQYRQARNGKPPKSEAECEICGEKIENYIPITGCQYCRNGQLEKCFCKEARAAIVCPECKEIIG